MDIIFSASIIAAFLAGMVALFAPCCITVLLPAYLASTFREKRNIVKMTFVFFAGIAIVLIPIGLGAAGLAQIFRSFHKELYIFGGLLMIAFSVMAVRGKGFAIIPMPRRLAPAANFSRAKSVFLLGVFSGAATSCCAPVLAGAVTLAVISGAFWKAIIVTFAYVFGMTFPLFLLAYFYDRFNIQSSKIMTSKVWGKNLGNLIAGAVFLLMGIALIVLAFWGNAFWAPSFQVAVGNALNEWSQSVLDVLLLVPEFVWGIIIAGLFLFFLRKIRKNSTD